MQIVNTVATDAFVALWFFLPAGAANGIPVLVAHAPVLRKWDAPMDGGAMFHGQRLLGSHKTWRGFIAGLVASTIVLWLQQLIVAHTGLSVVFGHAINYAQLPTLVVGPLFGIGALGGDAVESFFKRQRNLPPGSGWFPFDQIDYIIGGAILTAPFVSLTLGHYLLLFGMWLLIHLVVSFLAFKAHLKERPI
ncbi:MAG TPA: CDP-archaeol synthase [Candidatus Saccharimonadia bacterium]|jgi:CDP-2,3-bis-(O-geranylgeranyl)-sn-glycerol synthase